MQPYTLLLSSILMLPTLYAESEFRRERDDAHKISKRSIFQLGGVIECEHHYHAFFVGVWAFTEYDNYGCYCGLGGKGIPVDEIDKCCFEHDKCYDDVNKELKEKQRDNPAYETVQIAKYNAYNYTCDGAGNVKCRQEDSYFSLKVCECDKILAECLEKNHLTYSSKYKNNRGNC